MERPNESGSARADEHPASTETSDAARSGASPGAAAASTALGGTTTFDRALARWVADATVEDAARQRARQRWLRIQAEEEASVPGVLLDLAERGRPVSLDAGGHRVRGHVVGLGVDFAALRTDQALHVLVALAAIDVVHAEPGTPPVVGDRSAVLDVGLGDVLGPIAADRPDAIARTRAGGVVRGQLRSASPDVLRLRVASEPPTTSWVAVASLSTLVLEL